MAGRHQEREEEAEVRDRPAEAGDEREVLEERAAGPLLVGDHAKCVPAPGSYMPPAPHAFRREYMQSLGSWVASRGTRDWPNFAAEG